MQQINLLETLSILLQYQMQLITINVINLQAESKRRDVVEQNEIMMSLLRQLYEEMQIVHRHSPSEQVCLEYFHHSFHHTFQPLILKALAMNPYV